MAVFSDWFLPSKDELAEMYTNLHLEGVGGFNSTSYWSSSEITANSVWIMGFHNGAIVSDPKSATHPVRAIRTFSASIGVYSLRDTGPGGGLIFYIDGTIYYEAAPSDQSISHVWSNIDGTEIGATAQGTAIGTGQANTTAIIGQAGHTDSAAKLCADLVITIKDTDMNLGNVWDIVHTILKKEDRGNIIKPERFTHLLQQCHHEYFNQQYEKYAGSQLLMDSMRPFVAFDETITFGSGEESISDLAYTYKHALTARVSSDDAHIDIVTFAEWNEWANDFVMKGTSAYPLMAIDNTKLYISPTSLTAVKFSYLVELGDVKFDSGTTNAATTNKLKDSTQNFETTIEVGMTVYNTTDGTTASVTVVDSDIILTLDADIMGDSEKYFIIQDDGATNFHEPFFDYYLDANYNVHYLQNGATYTLGASEVYRDGTSSGKVVGVSHDFKWKNQDRANIVALLLEKLGVAMQSPEIVQYAIGKEQIQNVM